MSFTLPTFNLTCNIFTGGGGTHVFRLAVACNLAIGRRTIQLLTPQSAGGAGAFPTTQLLLPAGTDVRDESCGGTSDLVEVPAGSGRFYGVLGVDDAGKGFTNEHRVALLGKAWNFPGNGWGLVAPWPTPIP